MILNWLAQKNRYIDFEDYSEDYSEKPKQDLLSGIGKLYQMHTTIRPLLETTLEAGNFAPINN
jgi:hypothetical protein